jgi:hypothetical protein
MAFSITGDAGCEYGGGVNCHGGKAGPRQNFLGWMAYDRTWFRNDLLALTLGGGMMNNPGRPSTEVMRCPARPTSLRILGTKPTCGMPQPIFSTCPSNTLPGGWRLAIATRTFRIDRVGEALPLRAATTEFPHSSSVRPEHQPERTVSRQHMQPAADREVFGSQIFEEAKP